jgi:hypothetical protein
MSPWHKADIATALNDVRFSNRPFRVKRFQTIHDSGDRGRSRARASRESTARAEYRQVFAIVVSVIGAEYAVLVTSRGRVVTSNSVAAPTIRPRAAPKQPLDDSNFPQAATR